MRLVVDKERVLVDIGEMLAFYGRRTKGKHSELFQGRIEGYIEGLNMAGVLTDEDVELVGEYYEKNYGSKLGGTKL